MLASSNSNSSNDKNCARKTAVDLSCSANSNSIVDSPIPPSSSPDVTWGENFFASKDFTRALDVMDYSEAEIRAVFDK